MLSHYVNVSTGISFPMFVLLWDLSQKRISTQLFSELLRHVGMYSKVMNNYFL